MPKTRERTAAERRGFDTAGFMNIIGHGLSERSMAVAQLGRCLEIVHWLNRRKRSELRRIHAVETNPHPDPLPFRKGEGNLLWHRVRVTEQGSKTRAFELSSPRSERGEDQGEGRFRLRTYG